MKKLKVTAVSYLNTKPLLYGLVEKGIDKEIELSLNIPSKCARLLKSGEVDIGLIPVAVIPELEQAHIISDFCIGADGPVQTVSILAQCPIEEVTHLYLDFHSRTSVQLAQILLREYWNIAPKLIAAEEGYEDQINGTTAGVMIGDRVFENAHRFAYNYDLPEYWKKHTGLPFVFAAWVSRQPLDDTFINRFNEAMAFGIDHIPQLLFLLPQPKEGFDLEHYFTHNISYALDDKKREALQLFLQKITNNTSLILKPEDTVV